MQVKTFCQRILLVFCLCILLAPLSKGLASFRQGDDGDEVAEIQAKLQASGYQITNVDGKFGLETKNAVMAFQKDIGLDVDGVVGRMTFKALLNKDMPASRSGSGRYRHVITTALRYRGVPYMFGGTGAGGFDCSGFTQYVFAAAGVYLPRTADSQFEIGRSVSKASLEPGDLVFFSTYEPGPSHVGIYIGDGQFISSKSSQGVAIASIYDPYYWGPRYLGARRL